jgi:hypothetical protein
MVVASDNSWVIPDVRTDELAGHKKFPFGSKELEIVEKSIDTCFLNGLCERRKKPISKIFRDVVYQPTLEDIKEVDGEDLAEVEDKFDLTLSAIHRERALNSGCFSKDESRKYRKKKYMKSQHPIERRPRSQTF